MKTLVFEWNFCAKTGCFMNMDIVAADESGRFLPRSELLYWENCTRVHDQIFIQYSNSSL